MDRVIVVPQHISQDRNPLTEGEEHEREEFFAAMLTERFDLALQMHGGGANSNPFVLRLGARTTAGMKTGEAPALDRWMPYIRS